MIYQRLRKVGDSFVITIPNDEIERQGLYEGQLLAIDVSPFEDDPTMSPEVLRAFEESWNRNNVAYRYLADRQVDRRRVRVSKR